MSSCIYSVLVILFTVSLNAKHTYKFEAYVSIQGYYAPATTDTVYFRLCNTNNICGMFTRVDEGWLSWGTTYKYDYITNQDLGTITTAQIVLEGSDQLCLASINVDGTEYSTGTVPVCIQDESGGCDTMTIDLLNNNWTTDHTKPCQFADILDATYAPSTSPTTEPTPTPTSQPTNPTNIPTFSPTLDTISPTNQPTIEPTTSIPSMTPTMTPTEISQSPSVSPTQQPTASPTAAPFGSANVDQSPQERNTGDKSDKVDDMAGLQDKSENVGVKYGLIAAMVFGILFVCTLASFVAYCHHIRKKQRKHIEEIKMASDVSIDHAIVEINTNATISPMSEGNETNSSQMSQLTPIGIDTNFEGEYKTRGDIEDDENVVPMPAPQHVVAVGVNDNDEEEDDMYEPPFQDDISGRGSITTSCGLPPPVIRDDNSSESNQNEMMYDPQISTKEKINDKKINESNID